MIAAGITKAEGTKEWRRERSGVAYRPMRGGWLRRVGLTILVHRDAFARDRIGYIQGVLWRLRGLRVRSRHRIAALAGQSGHAYALWIAKIEGPLLAAASGHPVSSAFRYLIVEETEAGPQAVREKMPVDAGSDGVWLCVLGPGDRLAPEAVAIYAAAAERSPGASVLYADDDLIDGDGRRSPHFKGGWNPELFENHDFVTRSSVVRVTEDMLENLPADGWVETLVARALERREAVHVPYVLHHRASRPTPRLPGKPASLLLVPAPTVTVVVPTRNNVDLLRTCIDGLGRTDYPGIETLVVDNGSDEPEAVRYLGKIGQERARVVRMDGPFNFSALNNAAVRQARGEYLCFLNNDIEIVEADWLALMIRQAVRPDIGAVGARLLYPDGTVQHAGVVTGIGGGAGHAHKMLRGEEGGYFARDLLPQRISAVTAACLVVARDKFDAVGGFNEVDFPVAFNDVDLCMKLNARGWQSFYEPRAVLIHHESKSRGSDRAKVNRARFATELAALKRIWRTDLERDPFHHPHLSPFSEQFYIAV